MSSASAQAALAARRRDLVAICFWCSQISPIVVMLPGIEILLLEAFHIDSRSEFQWGNAAYSIICLVEGLSVYCGLSENLHLTRS